MEEIYYFAEEDKARNFSWELMKLPEGKVKIDKVLVAGVNPPYGFEITVRYWSDETKDLIDKINSDCSWDVIAEDSEDAFEPDREWYEDSFDDDGGYWAKELVRRDAALLEALAKGSLIKSALMDDPDACDDVDDIIYGLAMALTASRPGPTSETLNFVMKKINKEERFTSYE